jgi:Xaa-Pro aminopeptidase
MKPPHPPAELFRSNRDRLGRLLAKHSLAVVQANDLLPTNADGTLLMQANADLFYLTGISQEETILLLAPDAFDPKQRQILFLREPNPHLATWEGHKLSQEEAARISGIVQVKWLSEFRTVFHQLMCEVEHVYLNTNEHRRAVVEVPTRDARFIADCLERYPLHDYQRLARLMHRLRVVKSAAEVELMRYACEVTGQGFRRALRRVRQGRNEADVEAEFAHEFTRRHCRFAYPPIIAGGANACVLHYHQNDQGLRRGEVLLLDVAASYRNYNADLTRTVPVSGRFTRRQRRVYEAVLRVLRALSQAAVPGKLHRDWQREAEVAVEKELVDLALLRPRDLRRQSADQPAVKKYFMHGVGHPIGLDVHDVGFMSEPMQAGWVLTCEPGIYIPEERLGVRLENTLLITAHGTEDLMAGIPIEADEIEAAMARQG